MCRAAAKNHHGRVPHSSTTGVQGEPGERRAGGILGTGREWNLQAWEHGWGTESQGGLLLNPDHVPGPELDSAVWALEGPPPGDRQELKTPTSPPMRYQVVVKRKQT